MKNRKISCIITALFCALFTASLYANGQTAALTYQGKLMFDGTPADGLYDFEFLLFEASSGGAPIGDSQSLSGVSVAEGLFAVELDFGALIFDGSDRWLEIGVTTNGGGASETLSPRQRITATPYAIKAINAGTAGTASTANTLSGYVPGDFALDTHNHAGGDINAGIVGSAYIDSLIARDSELTWGNLADIPADIADGDHVGITSESDPEVGGNTANYVPKWNGSALVTGSMYDNGNVGINTGGGALDRLEVAGDISANSTDSGGVVFRFRKDDALNWTFMTAPWLNGNDSLWIRNETGPVNIMAFDKTSNRVGIHTTDPQATLHVAGDLRIDGDAVLYENITYANVQTGYVSVAAAAFHPSSNATLWNNDGQWIYPASVNNHFYAGVSLPQGATVTRVDWRYGIFAGEGVAVELNLNRRGIDGTGNATMATCGEMAAGSGILTDTTIGNATVDNSLYTYYLHIYTYAGGGNVQAGGVIITYTYSTL